MFSVTNSTVTVTFCASVLSVRYGPQKYTVVAGLHSLAIRDPKQHSYKVKKVHIHPGWEEGYEHDIALLELETPVQFNEHVQPVCLPDADQEWVEPGTLFVVTGWGNLKGRFHWKLRAATIYNTTSLGGNRTMVAAAIIVPPPPPPPPQDIVLGFCWFHNIWITE